jgi:glutathione S-transferase
MSLTFYYSPQSNASRVRVSLEELGVPFETVKVDLRAGDTRKPEFLAINPNGKVPTIVLDGQPMWESVAIQVALGERYGVERGLWPQMGTPEHLQALTWLVWGQVTLGAAVMKYMSNTSEWVPRELHHAGQAEAAMKEVLHGLGILDAHLKNRAYLTGASYTLADTDLTSVLHWSLHVAKVDLGPYPNLKRWLDACAGRPAFRVEG